MELVIFELNMFNIRVKPVTTKIQINHGLSEVTKILINLKGQIKTLQLFLFSLSVAKEINRARNGVVKSQTFQDTQILIKTSQPSSSSNFLTGPLKGIKKYSASLKYRLTNLYIDFAV